MFIIYYVITIHCANVSVLCPVCHMPEEEDDEEKWVGCNMDESDWWHRDCLSPMHQLLVDQQEEWACPLCQHRLERICDICVGSEYCSSDSVNWVHCYKCSKDYHSHCLSDGILTDALVYSNAWECMYYMYTDHS